MQHVDASAARHVIPSCELAERVQMCVCVCADEMDGRNV